MCPDLCGFPPVNLVSHGDVEEEPPSDDEDEEEREDEDAAGGLGAAPCREKPQLDEFHPIFWGSHRMPNP